MDKSRINSLEDLKHFLENALQLEHATLPPYLTALYSIKPDTNPDARRILRVIAVEEMLHMTQVANLLNAIGGTPDLLDKDFIPPFPSFLPDGEDKFQVSVQAFSEKAIDNFLQIEMPVSEEGKVDLSKADRSGNMLLSFQRSAPLAFETIGEFYAEILAGFEALYEKMGKDLFSGESKKQVPPELYFSAGAELVKVDSIEKVRQAIHTIAEQGEGYGGTVFDRENEIAHYYRFQQLKLRRLYKKGDPLDQPSGDVIDVNFNSVYPILTDPTYADYPEGSDVREAVTRFALFYKGFLEVIQEALTGQPDLLRKGMSMMCAIEDMMLGIIRTPIPDRDDGAHGTPIFRMPEASASKAN